MWSVNEFCEPLDHEFDNIAPLPAERRGVKLDDKAGLKQHCEFQQLKSADYLFLTSKGYCFLEFSDIGRQIDTMQREIDEIGESSNLSKPLKRKLKKRLSRSVTQEARGKYLDTCTIFSHASKCVADLPPELASGCRFLIVYAPFNEHINSSAEELIRFIDHMKNNLAAAIPDAMFHRVEIITLDIFLQRYY